FFNGTVKIKIESLDSEEIKYESFATQFKKGYYEIKYVFKKSGKYIVHITLIEPNGKELTTKIPIEVIGSNIFGVLFADLIIAILLISFIATVYFDKKNNLEKRKYNILKIDFINNIVKSRKFQFLTQAPMVFFYFILIFAGLYGIQSHSGKNIATVGLWTLWWILIIFAILFVGKLWCLICPIAAIGDWIQRGAFWKKKSKSFGLNKKWPKKFRNLYIAAAFFIILTWFELGSKITANPLYTAYILIFMLVAAIISAIIFERRSFCKYACFIGGISGLYSLMSPTELRSNNKDICKECKAKACIKGNEKGYGCPVFQYLGTMKENTYCLLCTECVKTCPKNNTSFNIRPFAMDLIKSTKKRKDEAYMALIIFSLTLFHTVTMTQFWNDLIALIKATTRINNNYILFTLAMTILTLIPIVMYYIFSKISKIISGNQEIPLKTLFINYAYTLLPVALFTHLAHNSMHLFRESQNIIPVLSDPFGFGWDLFGTASWAMNPILQISTIRYFQFFLVSIGLLYSILIAFKISKNTFNSQKEVFKSLITIIIILIAFSITGLYFMTQPMIMRTGM
ncbi:MAG: 4Fe-4S binding protein, partial [Methanosarcinales archaeon]